MSLIDAFMSPHPNGIHLVLLLIGLLAGGIAVHLDNKHRHPAPEQIAPLMTEVRRPYFNLKPCSCPSGDCPEWEAKAGLPPIDPECQIHGEQDQAA